MDLGKNNLTVLALLVIAAILAGAAFLRPQTVQVINQPDGEHSLSVSGQGTVEAKPDTATVSLGINHKAKTAKEAQARVVEVTNAIIKLAKAKGVAEEKIRTQEINLHPDYYYGPNQPPVLSGYNASSSVSITTGDIANLGGLIDEAVEAGANQMNGISFTLKDRDKYKQEAIAKAVDDARRKADEAATKLGASVIGVKRVHVSEVGGPGPIYGRGGEAKMMEARSAAPVEVMPGTVDLNVSVQVEFLIK